MTGAGIVAEADADLVDPSTPVNGGTGAEVTIAEPLRGDSCRPHPGEMNASKWRQLV